MPHSASCYYAERMAARSLENGRCDGRAPAPDDLAATTAE
jgi:hypothetical protein